MLAVDARKHIFRPVISLCAFLFALTSLTSVKAADFSLVQNNSEPGIPIVLISGEIKEGDTGKLISLLRSDLQNANFLTDVWLNSPGGNLNEATKIGGLIEKLGYTAIVPTGATCASACFFIWVSASGRLAPGELVIHRPYFDMRNTSKSGAVFEESYRVTNDAVRQYLHQRNVPANLIDDMMKRSSVDGYILSDADKLDIGSMSPARMEHMVQNCGFPNADKSRNILGGGGFSEQERKIIRGCSLKLYEMQRYEFFFGKKAQIAKDAFGQISALAVRLESLDPAAFSVVHARIPQIINSSQPETWAAEMIKLFNSTSEQKLSDGSAKGDAPAL